MVWGRKPTIAEQKEMHSRSNSMSLDATVNRLASTSIQDAQTESELLARVEADNAALPPRTRSELDYTIGANHGDSNGEESSAQAARRAAQSNTRAARQIYGNYDDRAPYMNAASKAQAARREYHTWEEPSSHTNGSSRARSNGRDNRIPPPQQTARTAQNSNRRPRQPFSSSPHPNT